MPELPEVESITRRLREGTSGFPDGPQFPSLIGKKILKARLLWARTVAVPAAETFLHQIRGQEIESIGRRGKFMIFTLSEDYLLIHLRMSGDLLVELLKDPIAPHHRLILELEDGLRLAFNDARKFGRVWLVDDPETVLRNLGPEPLDLALTPEDFYYRLQKTRRQLKPLLLDQSFLAGVGNIYADEALFQAKLHPQTPADHLDPAQSARLLEAIRQVLADGIRRNGASIDWVYRGGNFQEQFKVYQRAQAPCFECGTEIKQIRVGQRATHFCPACQVLLDEE